MNPASKQFKILNDLLTQSLKNPALTKQLHTQFEKNKDMLSFRPLKKHKFEGIWTLFCRKMLFRWC